MPLNLLIPSLADRFRYTIWYSVLEGSLENCAQSEVHPISPSVTHPSCLSVPGDVPSIVCSRLTYRRGISTDRPSLEFPPSIASPPT